MVIILTYDISNSNTEIFRKLCNNYLNRIQNSVFEGEITESKLKELVNKLHKIMDKETDSIIIYEINNSKWLNKKILGLDKNNIDIII